MVKINENKLAQQVSVKEGLKVQVNIAQIKEVQRVLLEELANEWMSGNECGVIELIKKHAM